MAVSAHFSDREVRCPHCNRNNVDPSLLDALEDLRASIGRPIVLDSAYRCEAHNRRVRGAKRSQHIYGRAADLVTHVTLAEVLAVRRFSGIGTKGNLARHVDVRHVVPTTNWTGGTIEKPTRWSY